MPIGEIAEAVGKRLRLKRYEEILRGREGLSTVDVLAVSIWCNAFVRHFLLTARLLWSS